MRPYLPSGMPMGISSGTSIDQEGRTARASLFYGNDIGVVPENSFVLFLATTEHKPKVALVNFH